MMALSKQSLALASTLLSLTLIGPAPAILWAQGREEGESSEIRAVETREVTVTATRTEKDLMEVPMSVGVVSGEDIKREPTTNVAEALAKVPGVTVMDGGMPGGKRVMIRSESPMRSLVLIDGVKVSEQKSMSGSAILIDNSQIERIEVIKGPASVLYGSEAIGGVVNIITKKGGDKPVGFSQNFVADSATKSVDIQSSIFGSSNGFNYRFSGSGLNAGKLKTGSGTVENSEYKNRYYSGQVGYDWDDGSFFVRADRYESEIHIPTNMAGGMAFASGRSWMNNQTDVSLYLPQWDRESLTAGLTLNNLTEHLTSLKLNAYMQNMKKDFYNNVHVYNWLAVPMGSMGTRMMSVTVDQDIRTFNDQDSFGGSLQSEWNLGDHSIIAGLDYNKDELKADDYRLGGYTLVIPPTGASSLTPAQVATYHYQAEQSAVGLFLQDEWFFADGWSAPVGLRQTWVDSSLKKNNNPNLPGSRSIKDSGLVGNVGLMYTGFDDWSLRAVWSQGYRFPPINQLYLGTVHGQTGRTLPNPDLEPETSNNYEIGARFQNGAWNLDLATFYSDSKNFITIQSLGNGDSQFANVDKARTFGVELGLDYTFEEYGLTPYTSAAWINRRITNTIDAPSVAGNMQTSRRISYETSDTGASPFQGRVGVKWERQLTAPRLVYADLYMNWASSAKDHYYDSDFGHVQDGGALNYGFVTEKNGAWQTLNLTLGTQWGEDHKWNASLSFRNIGNKAYTQADNTIEDPGFHVVWGVGFEY
ncbi:MAG: TonB-dependent receptor [Candidatus Adiutrix sp.]|jgi:hemoglobin/transferrin/lactoferrin receptor protein|nr:TonB-dependent receptor [Candidatus Adiutrix sp.]